MHLVDVTMFWSGQGGGVQRYLREKHRFLESGTKVRHTIVVPGPLTAVAPQVPGIPLPFSAGYRLPRNRASVQRVLKSLSPDLIEAGDPYQLAWAALRAGADMNIPVVAFYHSDLPAMAMRAFGEYGRRAAVSYVKRLYRRFDLVFAPSHHIAAKLGELGIENVVRQPLGVQTDIFSPAKRDPRWREELGIGADKKILLYVGRYAAEKNLPVLTELVARLDASYTLVTIGGGPLTPSGERVVVRPFEPDQQRLARAYASADAFVHAGDQETFGLAALEALSCGTPVIGCALGGIAELVDDSVGRSVARLDPHQFKAAVLDLFSADRAVLSSQARERALGYDWKAVLSSLEQHYLDLVQSRTGSAYEVRRAA